MVVAGRQVCFGGNVAPDSFFSKKKLSSTGVNTIHPSLSFNATIKHGRMEHRLWTREQRIPRKAGLQGARL